MQTVWYHNCLPNIELDTVKEITEAMKLVSTKFFILSTDVVGIKYPCGCLFEQTTTTTNTDLQGEPGASSLSERLTCLDTMLPCDRVSSLMANLTDLDKRSALLLLGVSCNSRMKLFSDNSNSSECPDDVVGKWSLRKQLDVGDNCYYSMSSGRGMSQLVGCCVTSKQATEKNRAIEFTVSLENGRKINTAIDRIFCDNIVPKLPPPKIVIQNSISQLTQSLTNLMSPKLRKSPGSNVEISEKASSWYGRNTLISTDEQSSGGGQCNCLANVLSRAQSIDQSIEEKETFFRFLLPILPPAKAIDDDRGRGRIHYAALHLLHESLVVLLNLGEPVNEMDKAGDTALHLTVSTSGPCASDTRTKRNLERTVLVLLAHGADVNVVNLEKETILTKLFKVGNFSLLEKVLLQCTCSVRLDRHTLADRTTVLECLIKIRQINAAQACLRKVDPVAEITNQPLLLRAAALALTGPSSNSSELALTLLSRCPPALVNELLLGRSGKSKETFLTALLRDGNISSQVLADFVATQEFDFSKCNSSGESPLQLSATRLNLDLFRTVLSGAMLNHLLSPQHITAALRCTISAYSDFYINSTFKGGKFTLVPPASLLQMKQVAFDMIDQLAHSDVDLDRTDCSLLDAIESCVDSDFSRMVKHLCSIKSSTTSITSGSNDSSTSVTMRRSQIMSFDKPAQCSICMDNIIDCSLQCGHTCCMTCGIKMDDCHACRQPILERRRIFIS